MEKVPALVLPQPVACADKRMIDPSGCTTGDLDGDVGGYNSEDAHVDVHAQCCCYVHLDV
jgi:hypothetical protein